MQAVVCTLKIHVNVHHKCTIEMWRQNVLKKWGNIMYIKNVTLKC